MEPNKILSANILDLIFDNRNKEYGAYELRVTYPERIKKSMIVVFIIAAIAVTGAALANSIKPGDESRLMIKELTLEDIKTDVKEPERIEEPKKPEQQPQVETQKLTQFNVVPDEQADKDIPTKDDLEDVKISDATKEGVKDEGLAETKDIDDKKGIVDDKTNKEPEIWTVVEVPAKYDGDWIKFLYRNLNGNVPIDNSAPAGKYNVLIQFVVDKEGNISDIQPLTSHGFGMEQEAIRVLKKAKGWKPGIQNGHEVKSYHRQPITFVVEEQ
jgi:protein TonB